MRLLVFILIAAALMPALSGQTSTSWLDRPMTSWNQPASVVPPAQASSETQSVLERRCGSSSLSTSSNAEALRKAGWVPFLHFDRAIVREEVEVIGGMTSASPGCEPTTFNLFVFSRGQFAGTLSPTVMTQGRDGAASAVRLTGPDTVTAEFARYTGRDTECCPSSRVRVTYRIEGAGSPPSLAPIDMRTLR